MTPVLAELHRMFPLSWSMRRQYHLPTEDPGQAYYIEWSPRQWGVWDATDFDARGVLRAQSRYNAVTISQYALFQYSLILAGDSLARERFFAQVQYLLEAQREDGGYIYDFANPDYGVRTGWLSAMAQGEAASVLMRAYALTNESKHLNAARRALEPLKRDVSVGGASFIRDGIVFFEEVASLEPCHVLNGHLYAAFAVWESCHFGLADDRLRELHRAAVRTLQRYLPLYDVEGWSSYDLGTDAHGRRHWAPLLYHQFHIAQLHVYASMTGVALFERYANTWHRSLDQQRVRVRVWRYNLFSLVAALAKRFGSRARRPFKPLTLPQIPSQPHAYGENPSRGVEPPGC